MRRGEIAQKVKWWRKSSNNERSSFWAARALALENANAKCKENLAFQAPKSSPSGNATANYCKFFCNSVTMQFYL